MKKKELRFYIPLLVVLLAVAGVCLAVSSIADDTQPPVITVSTQTLSVSVNDPQSALLQGVTAEDKVDGDVTDLILVEKISDFTDAYTATVTYAAFDRSGNVAKATRTICYTDYTSPAFSLLTPLVFQAGSNADVLSRIVVTDVIDGDISRNLKATLTGTSTTLSTAGTHQVAFRVTNSMGDTVRMTLPVDILPLNTYQGSIQLTHNLVYIAKGSSFKASSYFRSLTLGSDTVTTADGVQLQTDSDVNTAVPGVYSVAYTARYNNRQAFTRLIVIVE